MLIFSDNVGLIRRFLWLIFIVFGSAYSAYNIYKNSIRYFSYPSSIKPLVEEGDLVRFPKGF